MISADYMIAGGDFERGGSASKQLKELLKKLGADPKAIRRTMIAAYEAEMNTVIHAKQGVMRVALDAGQVDVIIEDVGPGIPDIPQAMREGFSTASVEARELGFGAGMGLPNISRNADSFTLRSTPGEGTQVHFGVFLAPLEAEAADPASVKVAQKRCKRCLACIRACPTQAIRVYGGEPLVLDHLCIDCTSCMEACAAEALSIKNTSELLRAAHESPIIMPGSLLGQFESGVSTEGIERACGGFGYREVRYSDEWEQALRRAAETYASEPGAARPVISPVCPAVVSLVRLRFPSLLELLAPFLSPLESAREELRAPHAVFVVLCPSQAGVLRRRTLLKQAEAVTPSTLCHAIRMQDENAAHQHSLSSHDKLWRASHGGHITVCQATTNCGCPPSTLRVSGMTHVMRLLESLENRRSSEWDVLELYACDQGCFGSPLWSVDAHVSKARRDASRTMQNASAVRRVKELKPRVGVRLDPDMKAAIAKLARIDALTKALPGRDCGVCGAPTCAALAEDVVLGRAALEACIYREPTVAKETI